MKVWGGGGGGGGGGTAEWTPISSKGCLAGSSGFCAPQGFVGEAWDPSID